MPLYIIWYAHGGANSARRVATIIYMYIYNVSLCYCFGSVCKRQNELHFVGPLASCLSLRHNPHPLNNSARPYILIQYTLYHCVIYERIQYTFIYDCVQVYNMFIYYIIYCTHNINVYIRFLQRLQSTDCLSEGCSP